MNGCYPLNATLRLDQAERCLVGVTHRPNSREEDGVRRRHDYNRVVRFPFERFVAAAAALPEYGYPA
jgi:hypothetical protein